MQLAWQLQNNKVDFAQMHCQLLGTCVESGGNTHSTPCVKYSLLMDDAMVSPAAATADCFGETELVLHIPSSS